MWPVGSISLLVYAGGWYFTDLYTGELLSLLPPGKMEGSFWMKNPNLRVGIVGCLQFFFLCLAWGSRQIFVVFLIAAHHEHQFELRCRMPSQVAQW